MKYPWEEEGSGKDAISIECGTERSILGGNKWSRLFLYINQKYWSRNRSGGESVFVINPGDAPG